MDLVPTGMAAGGDAIARDEDGRVVFVTGALPGERVRVQLTETRRDYARAVVADVLDASPDRVAPPCPELARGCGGCQWQHVAPDAQRRLKARIVADALRRLAKLPDPPVGEPVALTAEGYRTTVRAAVVDGRAGYRRHHAHDAVAVDSCLVAHPLLEDLLRDGRFGGADEVVLRCGARTGERLVLARPSAAGVVVPDDVTVVERGQRGWITEEVAGRRWRISAGSFFQARPDGADALAALVAAAAAGARTAVDLYAGVGLFAGVLADAGARVVAVEGDAGAVADARANLAELGRQARVVRADVARWTPRPAEVVVADPSRAGLGRRAAAVVAGCGARRVILISCDAAALGRDVGLLAGHGYGLVSTTPVDLFPHTVHVEAVSLLERADV